MEVNWKKIGLAAAGLGGFGYLAYKYYNAKEEENFKKVQGTKRHAKEGTKQELLQERIIEEIEAPFAQYCAEMGEFGFGKGFLALQTKLKSEQEQIDSSANLSDEQTMQEINTYITSFNPNQDELLKVLTLGQEMFDNVIKAKPFASSIPKAQEQSEQCDISQLHDKAKEIIALYQSTITSLSGDKTSEWWGTPTYISQWRHQWLFNTGLTLPLQVCMMKHLHTIFAIDIPDNFTIAISKLAKTTAHKYRIIDLDDKNDESKEEVPEFSSFLNLFNCTGGVSPTYQS